MPLPPEEPVCAEFQPNVFDPSRCHDCLRQKRVHAGAVTHTEEATPAAGTERATGFRSRTGNGSGASPETRTVTGEEEASPTVRGRDVSGRKEAGLEEEVDRLRLKVHPWQVNTPAMRSSRGRTNRRGLCGVSLGGDTAAVIFKIFVT